MLTKTTISAIRALMHLGRQSDGGPISPRRIARELDESPTYLAKVMRLLVKAGILRAHFGMAGGVVLNRTPENISLLAITEACQGAILANLCTETDDLSGACAFHRAGAELHESILAIMSRWTLADFLRNPSPAPQCEGKIRCWMQPGGKEALVRLPEVSARKARASVAKGARGKNSTRKTRT